VLFNSFAYALFLPGIFAIYWALQGRALRVQNLFLLAANYVFYGFWDYRFLLLLIVGSVVDFLVGIGLEREQSQRRRKLLLAISVAYNLGALAAFKYFGFFAESFAAASAAVGLPVSVPSLNVILPLGISFYTFQSLGYTVDVYKRRVPATRDAVAFFIFHSFFPQLIAGPIERAGDLLPQILTRRRFDPASAADGLRQILCGLLKKLVIASVLGGFVDRVWAGYQEQSGAALVVAVFLFGVQVYCDFSGYSDIAIGSARLLGFRLTRNFAYPFFAQSVPEFWRRWHVTLFTWFRDHVFLPLGGVRRNVWTSIRSILVTFALIGLWHGASWTYVAWGLYNGLIYIPFLLAQRRPVWKRRPSPLLERVPEPLRAVGRAVGTVALCLPGMLLFRAPTLGDAAAYAGGAVARLGQASNPGSFAVPLCLAVVLLAVEWVQRDREHPLDITFLPRPVRWAAYYAAGLTLFLYGDTGATPFIYLQF
jgi:alginate O-acetyltransferase complex protein AlgI